MPFIAANPELYEGKKVGTGTAVDFVRACSSVPGTGSWKQGIKVLSASLGVVGKGTVIATFVDGHFTNSSVGSHAAVFLEQDPRGIKVMDQGDGEPVLVCLITPGGNDNTSDANSFYVVEA